MRDLSLPQGFQFSKDLEQPSVRFKSAMVWATRAMSGLQPLVRSVAQHQVSGVAQNLMARVSLQQLKTASVSISHGAIALHPAAWATGGCLRVMQLHCQRQQQMAGVRVRAREQFAGAVLRRDKHLSAGLLDVGVGRHGADRSGGASQILSHAI